MTGFRGLRLVLVGPAPPPAGGMAMQTMQLVELLRAAEAEVEHVQTNAPYRPAWAGGLPIVRAAFRFVPYLHALWRAAGRGDVMHVMANSGWSWHLFAAPAVWVARGRRLPVVVNYRGGEAEAFLQAQASWVRVSMRRAAALFVPSGFLEGVFAKHGMKASVVPNVVDLSIFHPPQEPSARRRLNVLVARNLEPIYDVATALRAFAMVLQHHPRARMTVAGTGPSGPALQDLARELGLAESVTFAGRMSRDAMAQALRESAVALNPSLVDNSPNSVIEALASGVPVVSTRVGGVPFLVRDGESALLVPAGDARAMAASITKLLDEPTLASRLAEEGLRVAQRHAWAKVAPLLASTYARAMNEPTGARACTRT